MFTDSVFSPSGPQRSERWTSSEQRRPGRFPAAAPFAEPLYLLLTCTGSPGGPGSSWTYVIPTGSRISTPPTTRRGSLQLLLHLPPRSSHLLAQEAHADTPQRSPQPLALAGAPHGAEGPTLSSLPLAHMGALQGA
jgi:hypothetical protein